MLKAYKVGDKFDDDGIEIVVYAENASKAKKEGLSNLPSCDGYINLRAVRIPYMDGTEGLTEIDRQLLLFENGWWFEYDGERYDEENSDEFIEDVKRGKILGF